jgi:hypothetical protein
VLESARMFATLDPKLRQLQPSSRRKILMSDTRLQSPDLELTLRPVDLFPLSLRAGGAHMDPSTFICDSSHEDSVSSFVNHDQLEVCLLSQWSDVAPPIRSASAFYIAVARVSRNVSWEAK